MNFQSSASVNHINWGCADTICFQPGDSAHAHRISTFITGNLVLQGGGFSIVKL
jgi:hypothetical protein